MKSSEKGLNLAAFGCDWEVAERVCRGLYSRQYNGCLCLDNLFLWGSLLLNAEQAFLHFAL